MIRSFVALPVPDEVRSGLAGLMDEMRRLGIDAKFPRPESIHITLKFLGDVEESRLAEIGTALRETAIRARAFDLGIEGLGVFPHLANPRVVWTGIRCANRGLVDLQRSVEESLQRVGFPVEKREFQAHLTLARIRSRRRIALLMDFVERRSPEVDLGSVAAEEFHLYQSILRPQGAEYRKLQSFRLAGASESVLANSDRKGSG